MVGGRGDGIGVVIELGAEEPAASTTPRRPGREGGLVVVVELGVAVELELCADGLGPRPRAEPDEDAWRFLTGRPFGHVYRRIGENDTIYCHNADHAACGPGSDLVRREQPSR